MIYAKHFSINFWTLKNPSKPRPRASKIPLKIRREQLKSNPTRNRQSHKVKDVQSFQNSISLLAPAHVISVDLKVQTLPIYANYRKNLFLTSITKADFQGIQKFSKWCYRRRNISYFLSLEWFRLCNYLIEANQSGGVSHARKGRFWL